MMEYLVEFLLSFSLLCFYYSTAENYFEHQQKFRICAVLESKNGLSNEWITENLPVGYTFFTKIPGTVLYRVDHINDGCIFEFCRDGLTRTQCQQLRVASSFERTEDSSLVCTCTTNVPEIYQDQNFNQTRTGLVFSPYVKNWMRGVDGVSHVSKWNNYTIHEIKELMSIISTKCTHFSTYGMGATFTSRSWEEGDSTGLVPVATAQWNLVLKSLGHQTLKVTQGIYQNRYSDVQSQEIKNALMAAKDANKIFPGTVTRILFTSDYVTNEVTGNEVLQMIEANEAKTRELGLEIGIRVKSCTDIIPVPLSEANVPSNYTSDEYKGTEMETVLKRLMTRIDFIVCSNPPPPYLVRKPMKDIVEQYGRIFLAIQKILKTVNPNITIVAQAGWASWGTSRNGASNSLANMVEFWNRMNSWATQNNFQLNLFEAFDEPWKSDLNSKSTDGPSSGAGAEGHYGWWKRHDSASGSLYTYIPKVEELESIETDASRTSAMTHSVQAITASLVIVIIMVLGVTAFLIYRLRKAKKNIVSKQTHEIATEFREGVNHVPKNLPEGNGAVRSDNLYSASPENDSEKSFIFALRFPYDKKYELSKKKFTIDETCVLGRGHYGVVYKGRIEGVAEEAAFKTLNSNGSIIELKNLLSEIKIMSYVGHHDHIVNLLGAYTAKIEQGEVYVASEFCSLGSLENYLKQQKRNYQGEIQKPNPVSPPALSPTLNYVIAFTESEESDLIIPHKVITDSDLLKWGYQIACGMEHIASKKVIHADLATRNVLLTTNGTAKIADFGLSRQLYYDSDYMKSSTKEELPWRWMSLESLCSLKFSVESDVWSFGITLWEIFSLGDTPYPGVPGWTLSFLHELDNNDYRMDKAEHASDNVHELMLRCWMKEPKQRPSFTELKEALFEKWENTLHEMVVEDS